MAVHQIDSLKNVIGLGVAGNFAGHLEQAGEASDFTDVKVDDPRAPKGVFPFYVPSGSDAAASSESDHFLRTFPISSDRIRLGSDDEKHQIEPELALLCDLEYDGSRVARIVPLEARAHNDCSIRREGAKKISEKKNWGPETKGTATRGIPIDRFSKGGVLDHYRIASYLLRNGELHEYGVESPASSYSYMYEELLAWLILKLNDQAEGGPLENIAQWIALAGMPKQALISIGATRYTDYGETHFLERGDQLVVAVFDGNQHDSAQIRQFAADPDPASGADIAGLSLLRQSVV